MKHRQIVSLERNLYYTKMLRTWRNCEHTKYDEAYSSVNYAPCRQISKTYTTFCYRYIMIILFVRDICTSYRRLQYLCWWEWSDTLLFDWSHTLGWEVKLAPNLVCSTVSTIPVNKLYGVKYVIQTHRPQVPFKCADEQQYGHSDVYNIKGLRLFASEISLEI